MLRCVSVSLVSLVIAGALAAPLFRAEEEIESTVTETEPAQIAAQTEPQNPAPENRRTVSFPVSVPGTQLWAERLILYEGAMLEDGSDAFLVDAAALELYNSGDTEISLAEVTLEFEASKMVFFASNIPVGGRVLVIEQAGSPWTEEPCYNCRGWVQYSDDTALGQDDLEIKAVDMGIVAVTNLTENNFCELWLFHKDYLEDRQMYIGGITYITEIPSLGPGQTVLVYPEHYASGYSKFIKAIQVE